MRIFKWVLEMTDHQVLSIPKGAKVLTAQMQGGNCCLWALVDEMAPKEPRTFAIYGTGSPLPDAPGEYIATFQVLVGLVFHVFELTE